MTISIVIYLLKVNNETPEQSGKSVFKKHTKIDFVLVTLKLTF